MGPPKKEPLILGSPHLGRGRVPWLQGGAEESSHLLKVAGTCLGFLRSCYCYYYFQYYHYYY